MPDEGWRLNPQERTLTRALLVYRYSQIANSGVPLEWHQSLPNGEWKAVTDADLLASLNSGLKYRMAVYAESSRANHHRKPTKSPRRRSR
jgi:hypothetical protein